jgi:hypothetical protein
MIYNFNHLFSIVPSGLSSTWIDFIPIDKSMGYFHIVPLALFKIKVFWSRSSQHENDSGVAGKAVGQIGNLSYYSYIKTLTFQLYLK